MGFGYHWVISTRPSSSIRSGHKEKAQAQGEFGVRMVAG
jgi:hypothetical protein